MSRKNYLYAPELNAYYYRRFDTKEICENPVKISAFGVIWVAGLSQAKAACTRMLKKYTAYCVTVMDVKSREEYRKFYSDKEWHKLK